MFLMLILRCFLNDNSSMFFVEPLKCAATAMGLRSYLEFQFAERQNVEKIAKC
jgi:hypothetical protein